VDLWTDDSEMDIRHRVRAPLPLRKIFPRAAGRPGGRRRLRRRARRGRAFAPHLIEAAPTTILMEQDALVPESDEALVDGVSDWTEQRKFEVLDQLLDKTGRFSQFMAQKIVSAPAAIQTPPPAAAATTRGRSAAKRKSTSSSDAAPAASTAAAHECVDELQSLLPASLSLRAHQRVGVQWLISLYEQGLNGILADDMGLGKTLQLLTLLLHLRREGVAGPFLVVAPLSTLAHWDAEAKRVGLSSLIYHGDQTTRTTLRQRFMYGAAPSPSVPVAASKAQSKSKSKVQASSKSTSGTSDESDSSEPPALIITSYEVAMNDRRYLANVRGGAWRMLVVDEAHRLKNAACRLLRALHALPSEQRLLLTGTPLQNGLGELWSLLHFLMPVVFDDVDRFRAWFARMDDAGALESDCGRAALLDEQRRHRIVTKLHDVLRPFLLRRTKLEVFGSGRQSQSPHSSSPSSSPSSSLSTTTLPPKREITLSTPLTAFQRKLYAFILDRAMAASSANSSASDSSSSSSRQSAPAINIVFGGKTAISLQNVLMQLRLICCHPYLLVDHADESHGADIAAARALWLSSSAASLAPSASVVPSSSCPYTSFRAQEDADYLTGMIAVSAKLSLLHRLLAVLRSDGHKILIFSQFTRSLDIIQGKPISGVLPMP
jgi:ATP-dependent DNA helicase